MHTYVVYQAVADSKIEFLKAYTSDIGSFVSPAGNTILHLYIIAQSKREKERTRGQKLLSSLKSMLGWSEETTTLPSLRAQTVRGTLKEWPSLLWKANGKGDTPLHMAARHGHEDIVEVLIDHAKENQDVAEEREDMEAGQVGDELLQPAVWKMLHKTNADKETALHQAVRYGHHNVAKVLIAQDDPSFLYSANEDGETPLYMAAERDDLPVIDLILSKYTSPTYEGPSGRTAVHAAALQDSLYAVKTILKKKGLEFLSTKVDNKGQTPFHCNPSLLPWLEDKSVIFMADKDGNTPLHIAASKGDSWTVKRFIRDCPECFDLVDQEGHNALHLAVKNGDKNTVDLILENQHLSDLLKQKDNNGNTPLHLLATSPSYWPDVIKDHRFDRMAFNKDNLNPLDAFLSNKLTLSKAERRMKSCLKEADIDPGHRMLANSSDTMHVKKIEKGQVSRNNGDEDDLKDERESQLVVAALIATVTFAAGFTLPGGYIQEKGPDQGYAVLTKNPAFIAFVISDSFGLVFSCAAVFIHLLIAMDNFKEKKIVRKLFEKALPLTLFAIVAMVIAFITGTYAVLAHSPSLSISASVIGGVFFCLLGHLVEEARESTSFPIFRWIIDGVAWLVKWLLIAVVLMLVAIPYFVYLTFHGLEKVIKWLQAEKKKKNQNAA